MTIYFRVDCGQQYGLGHVVRCRTVANALHAQAPDVPLVFVTHTPLLQEMLGGTPAQWRVTVCEHDWETYAWIEAQAQPGDILIVDTTYNADFGASVARIKHHMPVVRIDAPWATPGTYDILVLPGMHHAPETLDRLEAAFRERLLVGAEYVMLREEMRPPSRLAWPERAPWLLFSAGGSDPDAALPLLYEMTHALRHQLPGVQRIYGMGRMAGAWALQPPVRTEWVTGTHPVYLQRARLCVTLWGTTVYEALAMGTPTLTIARTASEAEDAARLEAATEGAVQSLGTLSGLMRETLCDRLVALWQDTAERKRMHYASAGLLDGKGSARVARAVLALNREGQE